MPGTNAVRIFGRNLFSKGEKVQVLNLIWELLHFEFGNKLAIRIKRVSRMRLITNPVVNGHVSLDTIDEFEKTILTDGLVKPIKPFSRFKVDLLYIVYLLIERLGISLVQKTKPEFASNPLNDKFHLFSVIFCLDIRKIYAYTLLTSHNRSVYLFDGWPSKHEKILDFFNYLKIDRLFISSAQSAKILGSKLGFDKVYWIPEGINPAEYKQYSSDAKTIDVLALGRKYDLYHHAIVDYLRETKKIYLYEKVKGQIIFPTREEFIEGIARSKISICVPCNITHPERSGFLKHMTSRYLQSMVSKCLVVGHAPNEMIELFGYNPVIEIDILNPTQQLESILKNYSDYLPLIEKNYEQVLQNHTWENRWNQIKKILQNNKK